jgi:predicted transcriptional regulator
MLHPIDKYIIRKVKEKRKEMGLSQSQLAFELEQSNSFIAKVESGKYDKKYNVHHLNEISKILECNMSDLLPKQPL